MLRTVRINKPRRLAHIDLLLKNTMQKCILNIKLAKGPATSDSKGQQQPNSGRLNNRTEGILVVKTVPLFETLSNESGLVPLNRAICMPFDLEDPFGINDVETGARRDQLPSTIVTESLNLKVHGSTPVRNTQCSLIMSRFRSWIRLRMSNRCSNPSHSAIRAFLGPMNAAATARMQAMDGPGWRWSITCLGERGR
jgi:hypothetical protein